MLPWSFTAIDGGVNQVVNNLFEEMERGPRGWRPLALEMDWSTDHMQTEFSRGTKVLRARLRAPIDNTKPIRSVFSFLVHLVPEMLRLRRIAKQERIRVFNLHYIDTEALVLILLKKLFRFKGQVILSLHGSDIRTGHSQRGLSRWLWKRILRSADFVVACSNGLSEEALMLEPRARVVTIHNGIDVLRFAADSCKNFAWPPELQGRKIIIHIGAFQHRKGHDLLVRSFSIVRQQHPEAALVLVGATGPTTADIHELVETSGLTDSVWFFENVPHTKIFDMLAHSKLFALSSRWEKGVAGEGFAIALLEAGAARLPVVATASCGVPEIIQDGITGILAPLDDVGAIARGLNEMLENPDLAEQTAANLHRIVSEQFTWTRAVDSYIALFKLD